MSRVKTPVAHSPKSAAPGRGTPAREAPQTLGERVRQRLQAVRLRRLLREMEREAGPIRADVLARVEREWPID